MMTRLEMLKNICSTYDLSVRMEVGCKMMNTCTFNSTDLFKDINSV